MRSLSLFLLLGLTFGCSHHHEQPAHHHHRSASENDALERHCAYAVAHGDMSKMGKEEYKFQHGGKTYYFSSKERLTEFKKHLDENVQKARTNWGSRLDR